MSTKQIYQNYKNVKEYLLSLQDTLKITNTSFYYELVEHTLSSDLIINFVKEETLDLSNKKDLLINELLQSKDWFYSLNYNFKELSLDNLYDDYGIELEENSNHENETQSKSIQLESLYDSLEVEEIQYIEKILENHSELINASLAGHVESNKSDIINRFKMIKKLFPNGLNHISELAKETSDPVELFKLRYIGIISDFPPLYFTESGKDKISKIISYIQIELKVQSIDSFTTKNSIELLYHYNLKTIARYVNYSWNKLIHIVYPKQFNPWQLGKVDHGYWEDPANRIKAVRWIIEDYLNTKPENIWRLIKNKTYSRALFGKLGLSYLYNTHFNSLYKSLKDTYDDIPYWQLGLFPDNYWHNLDNKENAPKAFKWMLIQERIDYENLVIALKTKRLNRSTFNTYGLSTMFDYCFNRNFYELVEYTFPKKFKPWEIGNVKLSYWEKKENQRDAINWFLKEQDTSKKEIFSKIESKTFSKQQFKKSKLANFFKLIFNNNPEHVFHFILKPKRQLLNDNKRLLRRYEKIGKNKIDRSILNFILYGFNLPLMSYYEKQNESRIKRKKRRMKRIIEEEN